jgi:hypothetical protein
MSETLTEITKDEFVARFKARMIAFACAPEDIDGAASLAKYADQAAPTYWDEPDQRDEGPEACADAEMSCWEDDGDESEE